MVGFRIGPGDVIVLVNVLKKRVCVVCRCAHVCCWPLHSQNITPFMPFFFSFYMKLQLPVKVIMLCGFLSLLRHVWKAEELRHVCSSLIQTPVPLLLAHYRLCVYKVPEQKPSSIPDADGNQLSANVGRIPCSLLQARKLAETYCISSTIEHSTDQRKRKHIKTFKWRWKLLCYCDSVNGNTRLPLNTVLTVFPHLPTIKAHLQHDWTGWH